MRVVFVTPTAGLNPSYLSLVFLILTKHPMNYQLGVCVCACVRACVRVCTRTVSK